MALTDLNKGCLENWSLSSRDRFYNGAVQLRRRFSSALERRIHAVLFSFSSKNINLLMYSTFPVKCFSRTNVQQVYTSPTWPCKRRRETSDANSGWRNFTYFTRYCLTQRILSMVIYWLLINRVRHLHLLRRALALSIKWSLCVIENEKREREKKEMMLANVHIATEISEMSLSGKKNSHRVLER